MITIALSDTLVLMQVSATEADTLAALDAAAGPYPWTQQQWRDIFSDQFDVWAVRHLGTQQWVAAAITQLILDEVSLLNICVAAPAQGQGIAREVIRTLLSHYETQGARRMFLEVRASNRAAQRVYDALGFNEIGQRRHYYPTETGREDAQCMALEWA